MSVMYSLSRKITISLPEELVVFADRRALETNSSRSQVISLALAYIKTLEEERVAAEGYRFYAQEAEEFAAISVSAVSQTFAFTEESHYGS